MGCTSVGSNKESDRDDLEEEFHMAQMDDRKLKVEGAFLPFVLGKELHTYYKEAELLMDFDLEVNLNHAVLEVPKNVALVQQA